MNEAVGVEHVYPEALGAHEMTLPKGAVCDRCNSASARLDEAVAEHPHISATLFEFQIPGKRGRRRRQHGYLKREKGATHIQVPRDARVEVDHVKRTIVVNAAAPRAFGDQRFRRGLVKIALNLIAFTDGIDAALDARYDLARAYVRAPKDHQERWPYVQRELLGLDVQDVTSVRSVHFARFRDATRDSVQLSLLSDEFFVSLINPDDIEAIVRHSTVDRAKRVLFHGSDGRVRDWSGALVPPVDMRDHFGWPGSGT